VPGYAVDTRIATENESPSSLGRLGIELRIFLTRLAIRVIFTRRRYCRAGLLLLLLLLQLLLLLHARIVMEAQKGSPTFLGGRLTGLWFPRLDPPPASLIAPPNFFRTRLPPRPKRKCKSNWRWLADQPRASVQTTARHPPANPSHSHS
jgi:hypothetical protein